MTHTNGLHQYLHGPIKAASIKVGNIPSESEKPKKFWYCGSTHPPMEMGDADWLPEYEADESGIYFWCLRDKFGQGNRKSNLDDLIPLNVVLNNTRFLNFRKFDLDKDENRRIRTTLAQYINEIRPKENRLTYGVMDASGENIMLTVNRLCNTSISVSEHEAAVIENKYLRIPLDAKILDAARADILGNSRILKIGKADNISIKRRIDQYRTGTQYSITRYVLGFGAAVFEEMRFLFLKTSDANKYLLQAGAIKNKLSTEELEDDCMNEYKNTNVNSEPRGVFPPWEQKPKRYAKVCTDELKEYGYRKEIQSLLEYIENLDIDQSSTI